MGNQRWSSDNERDWRGAGDWRDRDRSREDRQFIEGHNPAGPAQTYEGREDRSWSAGDRGQGNDRFYGDYGARNYGSGGQAGDPGDSRRFQDRGYGEQRYGREGRSGQDYGYDRGGRAYGLEWSDRDSYDARRADRSGYGDRDDGASRYGRESYRGDYRRGAYGEYGQRQDRGYQSYGRDTGFGDPNPYVQAATDGDAQGQHRGRGPADYRRSDDRVREDVNDRLTDDAHIDASAIQVAVKDGEVTLSGTVDRRVAKRHAEDIADRVAGAKHVQNNLRVSDGGTTRSDTAPTPTTGRGSTTLS